MSHTAEIKTSYLVKNEEQFIESLREHFGQEGVEVFDKPSIINMWNGSPSSMRADIIIRRKSQEQALGRSAAVNDLGFRRNEDGSYEMLVDDAGFPQSSRDKVVQDYTARVAGKQLKLKGYAVKIVKEKDVVKVKASKYL